MKNPIIEAKTDLMKWISNLDDLEVLSELMEFKKQNINVDCFEETIAEDQETFEEKFAKGMTSEEMRKKTVEYIESLPWKK